MGEKDQREYRRSLRIQSMVEPSTVLVLHARTEAYGFSNDEVNDLISTIAIRGGQFGYPVFVDREAMAGPEPIPESALSWAVSFYVPWDSLVGAGAEVLMAAILQWLLAQRLRNRAEGEEITEEHTTHKNSRRVSVWGLDGQELGSIEEEETEETICIRKKVRK
jgi:hypothetical protein